MFFRSAKREREAGGLRPIQQPGTNHTECMSRIERALTSWQSGVIDVQKSLRCVTLIVGAGDEYQPLSKDADPVFIKIRDILRDMGQTSEAAHSIVELIPRLQERRS
jgi:hypothetical protein